MTGLGRTLRGIAAEEAAARLYLSEGATLLATRWRRAEGEIDLVVSFADCTVFVEVKARRSQAAAAGAISRAQWTRLAAAAARFLQEHPEVPATCRFDVVLVDGEGRIERIENAASFDEW